MPFLDFGFSPQLHKIDFDPKEYLDISSMLVCEPLHFRYMFSLLFTGEK